MVLESENPAIIHQAMEAIPLPLLQHLSADSNPEVDQLDQAVLATLRGPPYIL